MSSQQTIMGARVIFAFVLVKCILFLLCPKLGSCQLAEDWSNKIVHTSQGDLVGRTYPVLNGSVTAYTGIPYAEPPVGSLRFAKPKPKDPWQGVLNATELGPDCPNILTSWDEDCLTLNVYVPEYNVSSDAPFSVMVWIHGGGFSIGSGSRYDGSVLADLGRVIVVTLNYRLGVLGFLSTGDDTAKGNYGLWDQRLAIQWVKEHIGNFHGDPDMITVFGQSAGAVSVAMQAISPLNDRSLFQRIVLESGTAHPLFTNTHQEVASRTKTLGSLLNCQELHDSNILIECLRAASPGDILEAGTKLPVEIVQLSPYYPIVDGEFLPDYPHRLSASGLASQYDLLIGINNDEGSLILYVFAPDALPPPVMSLLLGQAIKSVYRCSNFEDLTDIATFMYTASTGLEDFRQNVRTVLDVAGDAIFLAPAVGTTRNHARMSDDTNTYMYYFTYITEVSNSSLPSDLVNGAGHAEEVPFVFGDFLQSYPESVSAELSHKMVIYWTNFVKTGNPNGDGLPEWPKYDVDNETYIILQPDIETGQRLKPDKMAVWNEFIPDNVVPSDPNSQCSIDVPARNDTMDKSTTNTVAIRSPDGQYVLGSVVGTLRVADEAIGGEEIAEYLGIPYAKPPLGDLRFRPPKDTGSWGDEPLGIPETPPLACPQDVTLDPWMARLGFSQTSEDCLTLNIHAPTTAIPLPVVVFIHGGFGISGTSSIYEAILLASKLKAVVVVPNYRLGALGFLTTGDENAPGNYGLHDVLSALTWVNRYIGNFGGDASRVTIIGHGAGAELAHFLVLSEKAEDLFQRTVLMSSTAISPPVDNQIQPDASDKAKALAEALECPTTNSDAMIKCLREKPASEFVHQTQNPEFGRAFPVVVDKDILKDSPMNLLKAGQFSSVDLIIGMTSDENAGHSLHLLPTTTCPTAEEIEELIRDVSLLSFHNPDLASVAIATEYLGKGGLDDECQTRGSFRQFMQDYLSVWSTLETARRHSDNGDNVYVYSFDHDPQRHYNSLPSLAGPSHADDLQFLFGDPYSHIVDDLELSYRLRDQKMSLEMMVSLKNFVYDGNPGASLSGARWPAFDSNNFRYMKLDPCPDACSGLDTSWDHVLRFWSDLIPTVTMPPTTKPPPKPTVSKPCLVGENIGLNLSLGDATTLIQALMGTSIGLLILAMFLAGGCAAYRIRAVKAEKGKLMDSEIAMTPADYSKEENHYSSMNGVDNIVSVEVNETPTDKDQYNEDAGSSSSDSE